MESAILWHFVEFICKERGKFILFFVVILIFVSIDYYLNWTLMPHIKVIWDREIDPIVGIATLIVALSVWINETLSSWKSDLPQKLTVIFIHEGNEVMRCNFAHLDHEADIRNLGQQIGRQMNEDATLKFYAPNIKRDKGEVCTGKQGDIFMHYTARFTLTELPENLKPGICLLWEPPFQDKPKEYKCQEISKN